MSKIAQFVTLGVDGDIFAVPVESVQEILEAVPVSRVPHAPRYLLGMIDVRGQSHPVIDLRIRLGLEPAPRTDATRIIILETPGRKSVGLLAERVFEVTEFDDGSTEPPPTVDGADRTIPLTGVARRNGRLVMIFDLARLFAGSETPDISTRAAA